MIDLQHSVRHIRLRLFGLLMQAFGAVVILTVVLLVGLLAVVAGLAASGALGFQPPLADELEAYFVGHGSWDGVAALQQVAPAEARAGQRTDWDNVILLDDAGRVLLDGRTDVARLAQPYAGPAKRIQFPLTVAGRQVGTLIYRSGPRRELLQLFSGLVAPVLVISFFTGLLTLLIGLLLVRRVVTPLADVIAAAQSVAAGDLGTRVQVRGPGDLRSLSDSFNRMADALQASDRQRRDLLADVAHELRTPLTVIRGKLEGVLDGVYPADEAHVAPVLAETYVLERLVEDLRLLTLAESRQLHFERGPLDLAELARQSANVFEAEAGERGIALRVIAEPALPPVQADAQRTAQVIGNLVGNALRFAPDNGRVEIGVCRAADGVELSVSDNGPGVAEPDLGRIFDRFWRGEKSRARAAGGAGLGLAIARQLVEAQGGSIAAANLPGGGLRVAFRLK